MGNHICIICQSPLTGRQTNACSRQCANKVYSNRRRESGKLRGPKPRKYSFICIICDNPGTGTKPETVRHAYCHRITTRTKQKLSSSLAIVHVPRIMPIPETTIISGMFWWNGNCKVCGTSFTSSIGYATCSDECQRKHRHDIRSSTKARYRARLRNATIERVSKRTVYQLNNYVCQICMEPTQPDAHHLSNMYPSLDHIIALANGGSHTYANVQTAHRICNSLKRDL